MDGDLVASCAGDGFSEARPGACIDEFWKPAEIDVCNMRKGNGLQNMRCGFN
jgi:hypothetical protein